MAIVPPPPGNSGQGIRFPGGSPLRQLGPLAIGVALVGVVVLAIGYVWFIQRVEVPSGNVLVLIRKVGDPLPAETFNGEELAPEYRDQVVLYPELLGAFNEPEDSTRFKGIVYEVLPEGRYFYDPFFWRREIHPAVFIEQDEVGILIRKYGRPLPAGKTVATKPTERGPVDRLLQKGRHNINPYAYDVQRFPMLEIPVGKVGIQRLIYGNEPENPNAWVVNEGERGVQPRVLPPGREPVNPYMRQVDLIDIRSRTLDLRGAEAIRFPSKDSFEIVVEATVEYAILQDKAPYVMVAIGDHRDIEEKLILPYARSLSRIEGSKLLAKEFITGETREAFQNAFFKGLRDQCAAQGIEIRATPIRRIEPPPAIANPISDRQVADQQIRQYQNEIRVAEAQAELVEQEEMQQQNQSIGEANRDVVTVVMDSERKKAVALTEANKQLEVAKLELEAARETAQALLSRGQADAEVIQLEYTAEAEPLRNAIEAFGGGNAYAQYLFYQKLSPALKSVLASTDGPFADIFRTLSTAEETPQSPPAEGGE